MFPTATPLVWSAAASLVAGATVTAPIPIDFCEVIGNKTWASPAEVRACISSFPVDPIVKASVIETLNKTLAFHTSTNYQIQAPPPFEDDVHVDLVGELARIAAEEQSSDLELHIDLFRTFKRANDGHCAYINYCYDSLYLTYLPLPLVLLTESDGTQGVFIAPEAFAVATAEFGPEVSFWQDALPGKLKGRLASLSGAKVLLIDGADPFVAVNANSEITGSYQAFGARQNAFFASYFVSDAGWNYTLGNFAQQSLPLVDAATLTVQLANATKNEIVTFTIPYRSRISSILRSFTNSTSYRERNCRASIFTNGYDLYSNDTSATGAERTPLMDAGFSASRAYGTSELAFLASGPRQNEHPLNLALDALPLADAALPPYLRPALPASNASYSVAQFHMLADNMTGVLALGSFAAPSFSVFQQSLLDGLVDLKKKGAKRLVVDVTNNGGGYICIAHWLHRIIIGARDTTEPQAGLDSTARASPLARAIVHRVSKGADPEELLLYNPAQWTNATHHPLGNGTDWMKKVETIEVNGYEDAFSQRLGQECQPFSVKPTKKGLFKAKNVAIVSNGRCASSCSLFSITMSKLEGVKTVVVGGKADVPQQYCGTVGGQSTNFATIDTEIKTSGLKNHTLAPPDFLTNSVQGITWRLGYGLDDDTEPEEWQDHPADLNLPLTIHNVNNPVAIWEDVVDVLWSDAQPLFQVQL
ncbi:hypothetical protein HGRIS_002667 [Hohenbuehelia grisea]|uniref:Tail specific protease domain-containing protein n=1 Tax=Hohenbuehelia grisea TaxID=104357 RepID=A0ABR3JLV5_9AGAR